MPGVVQFLHGQLLQTVPLPTTPFIGRVIIVTGANSGLGLDATKHLVRLKAAKVIMGVRDLKKGQTAREEVLKSSPGKSIETEIEVWPVDLSMYSSVVAFADRAAASLTRLDAAILNAGVDLTAFSLSEGLETTLTVNVTSTFLLALLLLPTLRKTATGHGVLPHLAVVGSVVHFWANFKSITEVPEGRNILKTLSDKETAVMRERYFLSKLLVRLCVMQLARAITETASVGKPMVVVTDVAPGWCKTALFRHEDSAAARVALRLIGRGSEEGSRTLIWGILEGKESHGAYMSEGQVKKASPFARGEEGWTVGQRIWKEVMEVAEGVRPGLGENL